MSAAPVNVPVNVNVLLLQRRGIPCCIKLIKALLFHTSLILSHIARSIGCDTFSMFVLTLETTSSFYSSTLPPCSPSTRHPPHSPLRGVSGGERKRVTLAEMLLGGRTTLFLDEISTGLDSATLHSLIHTIQV